MTARDDETIVVGVALKHRDLAKLDVMASTLDRSRSSMLRVIIREAVLPAQKGEPSKAPKP